MSPIIVMAGTPVDTQMGMDCLTAKGLTGLFCPVSENPLAQTAFQISSQQEKHDVILSLLKKAQAEHGCEKAFIYCNSLSGSVDFDQLAQETGLSIVTPLHVYRQLATRHQFLAVIAANAQGTGGIERTMLHANPALTLLSTGDLSLVLGIEAGENPQQLVERLHLPELAAWYQSCGAEALLLGCTHFPYIKDALSKRTSLPLIDPTEEMLQLLMQ